MMVDAKLRPVDLARAAGISVQLVRDYEAAGLLPPVPRRSSGYRIYTGQHLAALRLVRALLPVIGHAATRRVVPALHAGDLGPVLASIDERHAALAAERTRLAGTEAALADILAAPPAAFRALPRRLRIGAAAALAGVPPSRLRQWEALGLLHPQRDPVSNYRLYPERELRRLHIVALLHAAHHDAAAIQRALTDLAGQRPEHAAAALASRRAELTAASWTLVAAGSLLHAYVRDNRPGLAPSDPATLGLASA